MGVYIHGMEMPISCGKCPLHFYEGQAVCSCRALHAIDDDEILKPWKNKRKDCPLIPVPPHGRLIAEADAVETTLMILRGLGYLKEENPKLEQTVREVFATAPAIEVEEHG